MEQSKKSDEQDEIVKALDFHARKRGFDSYKAIDNWGTLEALKDEVRGACLRYAMESQEYAEQYANEQNKQLKEENERLKKDKKTLQEMYVHANDNANLFAEEIEQLKKGLRVIKSRLKSTSSPFHEDIKAYIEELLKDKNKEG